MTQEEIKARELVAKFQEIEIGSEGFHSWGMFEYQAKQCALICVDEILKSFDGFMDSRRNFRHELEIDAERYWIKVKEAITKIQTT